MDRLDNDLWRRVGFIKIDVEAISRPCWMAR